MRRVSLALLALAACRAEAATETSVEPGLVAMPTAHATSSPEAPPAVVETAWPPPPPAEPAGDRIYSKVRFLWIRPRPGGTQSWIGYLSLGDSVRVKGGKAAEAVAGTGASRGCETWYAVEPTGYVCTGEDATLDGDDPTVVELRRHAADATSPWPYRYGESRGAPVYHALPDRQKQLFRELAFDKHLERVAAARGLDDEGRAAIDRALVGVDLSPAPATPPMLLELPPGGRALQSDIVRGSTLAYTERFDHEGRVFLMTWDRGFVPADKVVPYPEVAFAGVVVDDAQPLPLAFFREKDRPKYRHHDGAFTATGEQFARLAVVGLTGREETHQGRRFRETREGAWIAENDATIAELASEPPPQLEGDATWLDISILGGTLVAYEGRRPVYATLVSPGRGGLPHRDVPPLDTASTPTGVFTVLGKFVTATMTSGSIATLVHAEVQYTQNFSGPYALHGAYWHDRFGEPKSGGCINLAPIDAQRIFAWTRPRLPPGWHGMRTITPAANWEKPTLVWIHR
jgi:hypothetical protein